MFPNWVLFAHQSAIDKFDFDHVGPIEMDDKNTHLLSKENYQILNELRQIANGVCPKI